MKRINILFVSLGNICRAPMAEGVMTKLAGKAGLRGQIRVDSAGTGAWHKGKRADKRARTEGERRGYELNSVARPLVPRDFELADLIVAMDEDNVRNLMELAPDNRARAKIKLLRDYDPLSPKSSGIPDPYYGSSDDFRVAFDMVEAACRGLFDHLRERYGL